MRKNRKHNSKRNKKFVKFVLKEDKLKKFAEKTPNLLKDDQIIVRVSCPIELTEEFINLLGSKIPTTSEDIHDIINIILIHYNRIMKNPDTDYILIYNVKKSVLNLARIFNYYIYDPELNKTIQVLTMIDNQTTNEPEYIEKVRENILAGIKRNENKFYFKLIERIRDKSIQRRYLEAIQDRSVYIKNSFDAINEDKDVKEEDIELLLKDIDNLIIE